MASCTNGVAGYAAAHHLAVRHDGRVLLPVPGLLLVPGPPVQEDRRGAGGAGGPPLGRSRGIIWAGIYNIIL